jgi:SAM-dependent methyltransferase
MRKLAVFCLILLHPNGSDTVTGVFSGGVMKFQTVFLGVVAGFSVIGLGATGWWQLQSTPVEAQTPIQSRPTDSPRRSPDVPYVPTPQEVVDEMLKVAGVTNNDVVYDLGSGDGRIVITAAQKYSARGVGIDINPKLVAQAKENAVKAGVTDRVQFLQQDLFKTDISQATVVTLYLLPRINIKLRPKLLQELKPGTRIVSNSFDMGKWKPEKTSKVKGRTIYFWTVPENPPANLLK